MAPKEDELVALLEDLAPWRQSELLQRWLSVRKGFILALNNHPFVIAIHSK